LIIILSSKSAQWLLAVLVLLLIFGTQMPGAWRDMAFHVTHLPWQLAKVAHFILFAAMACLAHLLPLRARAAHRSGRAGAGGAASCPNAS
jgi:hypothetical protein